MCRPSSEHHRGEIHSARNGQCPIAGTTGDTSWEEMDMQASGTGRSLDEEVNREGEASGDEIRTANCTTPQSKQPRFSTQTSSKSPCQAFHYG